LIISPNPKPNQIAQRNLHTVQHHKLHTTWSSRASKNSCQWNALK